MTETILRKEAEGMKEEGQGMLPPLPLRRTVPGMGPMNADIMLIGEAPGETEETLGRPFCGWSGKFLQEIIAASGLSWSALRIDNVVQYRPPKNNFTIFYADKDHPTDELQRWWGDLHERIGEVCPKVIIACGDQALKALTGHTGVTQWRGSVIQYSFENGDYCWIVPIVHPAFAQRCWQATSSKLKQVRQPWRDITWMDLMRVQKIVREGWNPKLRETKIWPTCEEVLEYLRQLREDMSDVPITLDIETYTPKGADRGYIACIGLTHTDSYAMCINFVTDNRGQSNYTLEEEVEIIKALHQTLPSHPLIGANIAYDVAWIDREWGLDLIDSVWLDTHVLHSLVYPELAHDLGFLVSIYTDLPYHKHLGRQLNVKANDAWWLYNCADVYSTHEIPTPLIKEAKTAGMWDYYLTRRLPLLKWAMRQHKRGLCVDQARRKSVLKTLNAHICEVQENLDGALVACGYEPLNVSSVDQVKPFLQSLGFKVPDTQEETLLEYAEDSVLIETIMNQRKDRAFASKYEKAFSPDGRIRTALSLYVTETTRLASRKDHFSRGTNCQNLNLKARPLICASPGNVLVELDLSQAEAREVAWYTGDEELKNLFKAGIDIHIDRAAMLTEVMSDLRTLSYEELKELYDKGDAWAKKMRKGGKGVGVHATNYKVGVMTTKKKLAACGINLNLAQIRQFEANTHKRFRGIIHYQQGVEESIRRTRTLTTALGGRRYFFSKIDDNTLRRAYANLPQRTTTERVNDAIVAIEADPKWAETRGEIILQTHDGLLLDIPKENWKKGALIGRFYMERPVTIYPFIGPPDDLSIPAEGKVGLNWGELKSFDWNDLKRAA